MEINDNDPSHAHCGESLPAGVDRTELPKRNANCLRNAKFSF